MAESPADADPASDARPDGDPEPAPESSSAPGGESPTEFGSQTPTRFAADVEYRGRVQRHDYLVRVRHRLLDTSFTVVIDGVEHDPKAEGTAAKKAGKGEEAEAGAEAAEHAAAHAPATSDRTDEGGETGPDGAGPLEAAPDETAPDDVDPRNGLQFRLEENFTVTYCTVRRPGDDGTSADAEVLAVRTTGLGGAGEVDVRHGLERWPLAPEDGSPSAIRDEKRLAHPTRYAALAALTKTLGFLLPLLGFGALFAGFLDPVRDWIAARIRPLAEWVGRQIDPVREWLADLIRPMREFLDELLSPVREFVAALLRPLVEAWDWVWATLRGWLPEIDLGVVIPPWVADVAVPLVVVVVVFVATFRSLRRRREKLDAARAAPADRRPVQPPEGRTQARAAAAEGESEDDGEGAGHGSSPT